MGRRLMGVAPGGVGAASGIGASWRAPLMIGPAPNPLMLDLSSSSPASLSASSLMPSSILLFLIWSFWFLMIVSCYIFRTEL